MADRATLLEWLNEAYLMENSVAGVLQGQLPLMVSQPELQERVREHIETTRQQAERLRQHIQDLGGIPATLGAGAANMMGSFQGAMTGTLPNPLIRDSVVNYATEHFEIGTYTALIAAAKALDEQPTVRLCEEIRKEEEEMARWLAHRLPRLVTDVVGGASASRPS